MERKLALAFTWPPFRRRRAAHLRLGQRGEKCARRLLLEEGLDILDCNYRGERGEIDIVAREDNVLCFIEVKTRHRAVYAAPGAAVGSEKKKNIVRTARNYLAEIGKPRLPYRFDVVEIILRDRRLIYAAHHRNAFSENADPRRRREVME